MPDNKNQSKKTVSNSRVNPEQQTRSKRIPDAKLQSDNKNVESIMNEDDSRFRVLFNESPMAIFQYNNKGILTDCNDKFIELFSASKEKIIGYDLLSIRDKKMSQTIRQSLKGKVGQYEGEYRTILSNKNLYISQRTIPFTDLQGNIIGGLGLIEDISKRVGAEQALVESESRYRILSNLTTDSSSFLTINSDGTFNREWINDALLQKIGYFHDELDTFEKWATIVLPEDIPAYYDSVKSLLSGKTVSLDFRVKSKSGEIIWINNTVHPELTKEGKIKRIISAVKEITQRKNDEIALTESRKTISTLLGNLPGMAFRCNVSNNYSMVFVSEGSFELTGYKPEHFLSRQVNWFRNYIYEDDLQDVEKKHISSVMKRDNLLLKYRINTAEGKVKWVEERGVVIIEANEVFIEGILVDITQQVRIEEELIRQKNLLDLIINNAPVGIWVTGTDGKINIFNQSFSESFGYSNEYPFLSPNENDACLKSDRLALDSSRPFITEEEIILRDGSKRIFSIIKSPLTDSKQKKLGVLGISNDITDRKLYEIELKKAIEKAQEADRLKSAFLANMSHEIRTPLNGVIGFAKYLRDYHDSIDESRRYLDIICNSADHLLHIINDIIDLSKIDSGQLKINPIPCNLNNLLDGIYSFFYSDIRSLNKNEINLRLSTSLPDKDSIILVDDVRLKQVFNNLLGNAIKFTHKGYVEFGYSLIDNNSHIRFFVKDTGIGIPQDKNEMIFERFRQVDDKTTRQYGGTGLGLAISKSLVELLGGRIWFTSKSGEGSVFYFTIPNKPLVEEKKVETNGLKQIDFKTKFSNKNILVVEDDENSYIYLKTLFEKYNVNVTNATNGREAVSLVLKNGNFDLVLMDLRLPEMSGIDAIKEIRLRNNIIPVIAQTANAFIEEKEACIKSGFNDFIAKPIDPKTLYSLVYKYL